METKALVWREGAIISCPFHPLLHHSRKEKEGKRYSCPSFQRCQNPREDIVPLSLLSLFQSGSLTFCLTTCACFTFSYCFRATIRDKLLPVYRTGQRILKPLWVPGEVGGFSKLKGVPRSHKPTQRANSMRHNLQYSMAHYNAYLCFVSLHNLNILFEA